MRLKEILKEKKMSGSELARQLGVSPAYINQCANGKLTMSFKQVERVAKILGVPALSLFDDYQEPVAFYCPHCGKPIKVDITKP